MQLIQELQVTLGRSRVEMTGGGDAVTSYAGSMRVCMYVCIQETVTLKLRF